jgi:hypothetical protein
MVHDAAPGIEPPPGWPRTYTWDAHLGDDRGAGGVAGSEPLARRRLTEALAGEPPGTSGTVWRSALAGTAYPAYQHIEEIGRAVVTGQGVKWR